MIIFPFMTEKLQKNEILRLLTVQAIAIHDLGYNPLNSGIDPVNTDGCHQVSAAKPTKEADKLAELFPYGIVMFQL